MQIILYCEEMRISTGYSQIDDPNFTEQDFDRYNHGSNQLDSEIINDIPIMLWELNIGIASYHPLGLDALLCKLNKYMSILLHQFLHITKFTYTN